MTIVWQMDDRDTLGDIVFDFDASLTKGSNHLGVHLDGEGPTGAQASGEESDPTVFWIVKLEEPDIDVRGLGGTRGRRYDQDWQCWAEPAALERTFRTEGQALLTFLDARTDSGWKYFLEDAVPEENIEYIADLAGRSIRIPAFAGAS